MPQSRFDYLNAAGDPASLTLALGPREWTPAYATVGGRAVAGSGVAASYVVRTDRLLDLPVRIEESEWPAFRTFLRLAQEHQLLTWYPDATELGTSFSVYLHAPALGAEWIPTRRPEYMRVLEGTLTLRDAGSATWPEFFS